MDKRKRYSVYDIIPASHKFRNICEDPFFKVGVESFILSISLSVRERLFIRATNRNDNFCLLAVDNGWTYALVLFRPPSPENLEASYTIGP